MNTVRITRPGCWLMLCCLSLARPASGEELHALLITGGCCHDYTFQSKKIVEGTQLHANIQWTVLQDPRKGTRGKIDLYNDPNWAGPYDVVVHNECFAATDDADYVQRITNAHKAGTGAVVIHCAMHTYRSAKIDDWREFLGVTSRRHEHQSRYPVKNVAKEHPVMKGFPALWTSPKDELYVVEKTWPAATVLATAKSERNDKEHPAFWVNQFGKARVFGTTFGHGNATFEDEVFIATLTRGLLWAANALEPDGSPKAEFRPKVRPASGAAAGWRKHSINDQSPFEAAGAADFNGDGLLDIFSGDSWYQAPDWKRHKVREVRPGNNPHYYEDFADLPLDVNGDGKPDIVTCNYFSHVVGWVEHPGDPTQPWIEHVIDKPCPSETGQLVDIDGDGDLDFLPNTVREVSWYEIASKSPAVVWKKHALGKKGAGHGVGYGDINRDGRLDIITPKGWHEQPEEKGSDEWPFHSEFQLGGASILIIGEDFDGDGDTDLLCGNGHAYGLFWLRQEVDADGKRVWTKADIDNSFSQVHVLHPADLDGDGQKEIVTGKRIYAHEVEPGATDAPCIYTFHYDREKKDWVKRTIYEGEPAKNAPEKAQDRWALKDFERGSAGTGLQIDARDMDGDGDIDLVCPGKSGLYLLENLRISK